MNEAPFISAADIRKTYRLEGTTIEVLRGVSLDIARGETVSIMGASGAGKSTLLHVLGGLDRPTAGTVRLDGENLYAASAATLTERRATVMGFVFQAYHLLQELDVLENVMLPAMSRRGALSRQQPLRDRAAGLLEKVGLTHRARHRPVELSGGEQQRVALARSLMNEPELILADEPTGNLDSQTGQQVLEYLFALTGERRHTLILVTHNDAVAGLCGRRLVLKDGRLENG